jgi:hypothetical protein
MSEEKDTEGCPEEDITGNIYNLSAALSNLEEFDPGLMPKSKQAKLARMKRRIFNALLSYCDCLPQEPTNPDESEG